MIGSGDPPGGFGAREVEGHLDLQSSKGMEGETDGSMAEVKEGAGISK